MKAKEHAARLVAARTQDEYEAILFSDLDEMVFSTIAAMKKCEKAEASLGCIRDTFTKWKSIVARVKAANPALVIDEALFVKYFSAASAPLFVMGVEGKAFLGYTLDEQDLQVAREGKNAIAAVEMRDRLVRMQREARALGIDPRMLLASAVFRGEISAGDLLLASIAGGSAE